MKSLRKNRIRTLLKGIETGDPSSVEVINPEKYIQHNPQTYEGREGLATLFKQLSLTHPKVNIVRIFEDGNYVFAHTEYDFSQSNIGIEVFRFEGNMTVEHWDNIQLREGPNDSGHTMVSGPTDTIDQDRTEQNRQTVESFVQEILISGIHSNIDAYIDKDQFIQHNPRMTDGTVALIDTLKHQSENTVNINYKKNHRILADGNYVLAVNEGDYCGKHSAIYDLFRVENGFIAEHWDTIEAIPPVSKWKNNNGKF